MVEAILHIGIAIGVHTEVDITNGRNIGNKPDTRTNLGISSQGNQIQLGQKAGLGQTQQSPVLLNSQLAGLKGKGVTQSPFQRLIQAQAQGRPTGWRNALGCRAQTCRRQAERQAQGTQPVTPAPAQRICLISTGTLIPLFFRFLEPAPRPLPIAFVNRLPAARAT